MSRLGPWVWWIFQGATVLFFVLTRLFGNRLFPADPQTLSVEHALFFLAVVLASRVATNLTYSNIGIAVIGAYTVGLFVGIMAMYPTSRWLNPALLIAGFSLVGSLILAFTTPDWGIGCGDYLANVFCFALAGSAVIAGFSGPATGIGSLVCCIAAGMVVALVQNEISNGEHAFH